MKNDLDYNEQMISVNKMLADMKHDLNKEHHWDERAKSQDKHWDRQKNYWIGTVILAALAIVGSTVAVILSK